MSEFLSFYFKLLLRRLHWIVLVFAVFTVGSVYVASVLPAMYRSGAQLLVEPPQIPTQLAASTVQTTPTEELQIIQQRLMTRVNLIDIARSEDVFPDIGQMTPDEIVKGMVDSTAINTSTGRGQATVMSISFENEDPRATANVVNRYVTILLQDSTELRADRAGTTLEFFEVEVERLGAELERQSAAILDFNNANSDALPTTLGFRLNQQGNLQARIKQLELDIQTLEDQRARIIEIFQATGNVTGTNQPQTPAQQQLMQLENQLSSALALYSPEHPRVKLLEAQIERQAEIVSQEVGVAPTTSSATSGNTILEAQLADIDARIAVSKREMEQAKIDLERISETIDRTPSVQIQLDALNREYANIQGQYNRAVDGLAQAATGERIELLAKGQRITVIDPATVPNQPYKPNRMLIAAGGSIFGLGLGIAVVLLIELLNPAIRREADITRSLGITPLVTIPYVRTPLEIVARRAVFVGLFLAFALGLPALLFAVHTYWMPLDLIYERIASRLGTIL